MNDNIQNALVAAFAAAEVPQAVADHFLDILMAAGFGMQNNALTSESATATSESAAAPPTFAKVKELVALPPLTPQQLLLNTIKLINVENVESSILIIKDCMLKLTDDQLFMISNDILSNILYIDKNEYCVFLQRDKFKLLDFLFKLILSRSFDIKIINNNHSGLLHLFIFYGLDDIVKLLIYAGVNINIKNKQLLTPLHYAYHFNRPEMIKFLIDNGADVNALDKFGKTPVQLRDIIEQ